ncbi:MAG TPA: hypothetical protein DDZ39_01380 [Flavobacteriaceae bacterium]|jgi:hypothetical protein|nr:hypothetical protein [Flavobacteriaceae bacterium]
MKFKLFTLLVAVFISNTIIGQSLNEYKYVIIPAKYDFLKFNDQHKLNSLTKFLFEKEGFKTIYDNLEKPADLSNNPCSALTANVMSNSGMFTTKIIIELINCKNQKVLVSKEGKSKEKDYKKGFQEALRNAFESVTAQKYNSSNAENSESVSVNSAVEEAKKAAIEVAANVVEIIEPSEDESSNEIAITKEEVEVEGVVLENEKQEVEPSNVLYAQANALGYQLIDSTPKVIYVLLKSTRKNVYFLRNKKGIVYKENDQWIVEYYDLDTLVKEVVAIKF